MEDIRQYLLSMIAVAAICGIVHGIIDSTSTYGSLMHLLTGVVLLVTLISPVRNVTIPDLLSFPESFSEYAQEYIEEGTDSANQAKANIIESQIEAYILNKAASVGGEVTAEVEISNGPDIKPIHVILQGTVSPYVKQIIEDDIEKQLGISRENQEWI